MSELPLNILRSIGKYEPIETDGLTLYPIRVENYYEFLAAKPALDFMQQSLPIQLMSIPLLDAYFLIDTGQVEGMKPTGLFMSACLLMSLALRLMPHGTIEEQIKKLTPVADPKNPNKLKGLKFIKNGEEVVIITPIQFQRLRPIIAAQNGIELMRDTANPELVQAERDLAETKAPKLDFELDSLVTAAAITSGAKEEEIYNWAILKLTNRLAAVKRMMDYMSCAIGESQGAKWKGGNPVPHPWFNRTKEEITGLVAIEDFAGGQGVSAIKDATG